MKPPDLRARLDEPEARWREAVLRVLEEQEKRIRKLEEIH